MSSLSASSEENVVKNRLLFDGDGNGDDRRLNMLLKLTTKWGHATNPNGDPEEDIKVRTVVKYKRPKIILYIIYDTI